MCGIQSPAGDATRRPRLRTADRVTRLIDTMTDTADRGVMRDHGSSVCPIPVGGYGTTEFRMSAEKQQKLIESGRRAMKQFYLSSQSAKGAATTGS
jgi:NTE family protein